MALAVKVFIGSSVPFEVINMFAVDLFIPLASRHHLRKIFYNFGSVLIVL